MKKQFIRILTLIIAICLIINVGAIGVTATSDVEEYKYKEHFKKYYDSYYETTGDEFWIYYDEIYEYYSKDSTSDEQTPEFAVVYCYKGYEFTVGETVFGDYVVTSGVNYPYCLALYVITLDDYNIYTLTEAYRAGIDGMDEMLNEWFLSRPEKLPVSVSRIGDVDRDQKITVKDATVIQKYIVGLQEIKYNDVYYNISSCLKEGIVEVESLLPKLYMSDFNYDAETNIKDATAIQKYIAGIIE